MAKETIGVSNLTGLTPEQIKKMAEQEKQLAFTVEQSRRTKEVDGVRVPFFSPKETANAQFYEKKRRAAANAERLSTRVGQNQLTPEQLAAYTDTAAGIDADIAASQAAVDEAAVATTAAEEATKEAEKITSSIANPDPNMQNAYERLYKEFKDIGLESLVEDSKKLLMGVTRIADMPEALRGTKAYMDRFAANQERIKSGLRALTPAEYVSKEDAYQKIMKEYGMPTDYYKTGTNGRQEGFEKLLASDIDDGELEERIVAAQDFLDKGPKSYLDALKQFYPEISRGDLMAYVLDPKNAIQNIKRKVKTAEIGGAALANNLQTSLASAEYLAGQGVTADQYSSATPFISEATKLGGQLSSIYNVDAYSQADAEAEALNISGAAQAAEKRKKIKSLQEASFGGSSGVGALGRDRANSTSGAGSY